MRCKKTAVPEGNRKETGRDSGITDQIPGTGHGIGKSPGGGKPLSTEADRKENFTDKQLWDPGALWRGPEWLVHEFRTESRNRTSKKLQNRKATGRKPEGNRKGNIKCPPFRSVFFEISHIYIYIYISYIFQYIFPWVLLNLFRQAYYAYINR